MKAANRQDLVIGNTYYMDIAKEVTGVYVGKDIISVYFKTEDPKYYTLSTDKGYLDCIAFLNDPDLLGFIPYS